jgi:hypothetical protein
MMRRIAVVLACLVAVAVPAAATPLTYAAYLSGPNESPANASPGTGIALVTIDAVTHLLEITMTFQDLVAGNTASHIHVINGPGDTNTADTVGPVATTTPTFPGFPGGVTAGFYHQILDMTSASSYRAGFITDAGGTTALAEAALFAGITGGRAYVNIHSTSFPGGEIRDFLQPVPEPGTLVLLSAGIGGLARMRRRRQV